MSLRGSLADFPLDTIVRLIQSTSKSGRLDLRGPESVAAALDFDGGRLVGAAYEGDAGPRALGAVFAVTEGQFEFQPGVVAGQRNLEGEIDQLLARAGEERERIVSDRRLIPDPRARFRLSQRAAARGDVTMSAQQWSVLLAIGEGRDLRGIAAHLSTGSLVALGLVADLVRAGVIDVADEAPPAVEELPRPAEPEPVREAIETVQRLSTPESITQAEPEPEPEPEPPAPPAAPEPWVPTALDSAEPIMSASSEAWTTDDRLAALSGIFGPGTPPPDVETAEPEPAREEVDLGAMFREAAIEDEAQGVSQAEPQPTFDSQPATDFAPATEDAPSASDVGAASEAGIETPAGKDERKRSGLFGIFRQAPVVEPAASSLPASANDLEKLAAFANALIEEFNSGRYGKERISEAMTERLMRVDEQADPIDRALPVESDRLDLASIGRAEFEPRQVVPYLALLVNQIHDDAERAMGRDRARKGYRAAQQQVFGADTSALASDDVAKLLPRV